MSYRFGLNGNDLNWEMFEFLPHFVPELEYAIINGEAELDEDGNITDEYYQGVMDGNPRMVYYKAEKELNLAEIVEAGEHLEEHVEFAIIHDTNDNFVSLIGEVPDDYFTEQYLEEKAEAEA